MKLNNKALFFAKAGSLILAVVTTIPISILYALTGFYFITILGGLAIFLMCLKKKTSNPMFYIKMMFLNVLVWILPIVAVIIYSSIIGY